MIVMVAWHVVRFAAKTLNLAVSSSLPSTVDKKCITFYMLCSSIPLALGHNIQVALWYALWRMEHWTSLLDHCHALEGCHVNMCRVVPPLVGHVNMCRVVPPCKHVSDTIMWFEIVNQVSVCCCCRLGLHLGFFIGDISQFTGSECLLPRLWMTWEWKVMLKLMNVLFFWVISLMHMEPFELSLAPHCLLNVLATGSVSYSSFWVHASWSQLAGRTWSSLLRPSLGWIIVFPHHFCSSW